MDVHRLSSVLRAVRLHRHWRQSDVAEAAGVSRSTIWRAESALITSLQLETIGRIAAALDIRVDVLPRWRGGELDRLMNAGHSAMHEQVAAMLGRMTDWQLRPEVSFSVYGERGTVDILAFHPSTGALLVVELKTALVDIQALIGSVDRYRRLAPRIAADIGWRARHTSSWVIVSASATNRRRVLAHATVLRAAFPMDGRSIRPWLRSPAAPIRALSFLDALIGSKRRSGVQRMRHATDR